MVLVDANPSIPIAIVAVVDRGMLLSTPQCPSGRRFVFRVTAFRAKSVIAKLQSADIDKKFFHICTDEHVNEVNREQR